MATRHVNSHTYDKENACEVPYLKTGKPSGKEPKQEHLILGAVEEEFGDGELVAAKRRMKQRSAADFVLSVQACCGPQEEGL